MFAWYAIIDGWEIKWVQDEQMGLNDPKFTRFLASPNARLGLLLTGWDVDVDEHQVFLSFDRKEVWSVKKNRIDDKITRSFLGDRWKSWMQLMGERKKALNNFLLNNCDKV